MKVLSKEILLGVANLFTYFRMLSIVVVIFFWFYGTEWALMLSTILFIFAGVSDLIDGYLARKHNQSSEFGALLDLVADKILVATGLILIIEHYSGTDNAPAIAIFAIIILLREFVITSMREWVMRYSDEPIMKASLAGKVKTTMQIIGISTLMVAAWPITKTYYPWLYEVIFWLGFVGLAAGMFLALISVYQYTVSCVEFFATEPEKRVFVPKTIRKRKVKTTTNEPIVSKEASKSS